MLHVYMPNLAKHWSSCMCSTDPGRDSQLQLERGPGNVKKINEHADMTWLKMQMDMHDTQ